MNGPQQRKFGGFSFYVILMIAILAVTLMMSRSDKVKDTSLFEVEEMIRSGQVESVTIDGATLNLTMTEEAVKAGSAATVKKDIPPIPLTAICRSSARQRPRGRSPH